ncbi:MAG: 23S rRNA (uracil(1939)-C(5))-methyltransferase RlmD, partial [Clostridia bacterium]|nr:23S rRNA (uracil(1939)-C(5))-methyltransferase RlmD [Clostridia bacterium]
MVEKNKRCQIEITDVASDGNGVGAIDGFAVFVPMTAKGDVCEIVIVKVLSHYAVGRLMEIKIPSPDRIEPLCPVFKRCGGCHLQHIKYSVQLEIKRGFVEAAMRRIGGFSGFKCDEVIGMDEPWRYRNKCVYPIGTDKNGNTLSGFYARRSHDIIPVGDCLTGRAVNEEITDAVLEYMKENDVSAYDEGTHKGRVRRVFIRSAETTGEIMVVISVNGRSLPRRERLVKRLREASEDIVSVYININTERNNTVLGRDNKLIYGKATITDTLCGISFKISPHSFYQINPKMTEKLYGRAIEYADIKPEDVVLDVYCGIGTISLAAARCAKKVYGIEIVEQAIINARENAKNNGIENAEFFADSAEAAVPRLIESGICPDTVILDPPRKGSDEVTLNAIVTAQPKRIVYVSCNPATLARDTKYLAQHGYA